MRALPKATRRYHDLDVIAERNKTSVPDGDNWLWAHAITAPGRPGVAIAPVELCLKRGKSDKGPDGKYVEFTFFPDTILFDGTECYKWPEMKTTTLTMAWSDYLKVCRRRLRLQGPKEKGAHLARIRWPVPVGKGLYELGDVIAVEG